MFAETACERVTGEKDATVGGFGSAIEMGSPSPSLLGFKGDDIESNQGVSIAAIYNVIARNAPSQAG